MLLDTQKFFNDLFIPFIIALLMLFCTISQSVAQTQSRLINFQGKLTDQQGQILDGTYTVIFSIYATTTGGTALWTERHENLSVSDGLVNILLGSIKSLDEPQKVEFNEPRYLGITIDVDNNANSPDPEMLPRQRIASAIHSYNADKANHAYNADKAEEAVKLTGDQTYLFVPSGVIVMWSGNLDSIPEGWALCDGTNGTPDLRDRFILGAASGENPGATGGTHTYNLSVAQLPSHSHSGSTSSNGNHNHSASVSPNPHSHAHGRFWQPILNGGNQYIVLEDHTKNTWYPASVNLSVSIGNSGAHSHSFTTNSVGSGSPVDNRPAYYSLAFIMKL